MDEDILGEAYEEVIKDVMTGKVLGQFFTPPKVKQMMVNLIDPQLNPDGTIETIFDPAMGTGGFLISCLRNIVKKSKSQNIPLNWDFISQQGIGGREAEPDTYQLAISNMLIASGKMFNILEKGDSIRDPIVNKYDIILANPPFGIDGLTYNEIIHPLRNEYMPISSNSAVPLFLQAIIHMLKVNGRCSVVLPEGQELFSKSKALVAVREYLMKTCDLKEVIYLPAGTFTHTSIKTCVFYFHKKKEGKEVLETKLKHSKTTNKETERLYVFSKAHQTHKVKFYDYNTENDTKHLLLEVAIEDLTKNNYSLNYAEYLKDETAEEVYEDGVVVKTLGEVCSIDCGTRIVKGNNTEGEYPVYGSGRAMFSTTTFNREGYNILIGRFALSLECVRIITDKIFLNDSGLSVKPKDIEILLHKYVGYYLYENQNIIYECARGTAQKNLDMDKFKAIKIPIPSLDRQQEIVKYLDFIYEKCIKTSTDKITELNQLNWFCLSNQKIFCENSVKTLGEICEFKNGKSIKKDRLMQGEYPVIGGGQKPMGLHNEYNVDENVILCSSSGAYAGFISRYNKKVWASDCFSIKPKNKMIDNNYLYYALKLFFQDAIYKQQTGTAQPHIYSKNLESLKIPVPTLERQKEIVDYCGFNNILIQQLEKDIKQNKKQANLFISSIVKTTGVSVPTENERMYEDPTTTPIIEEVLVQVAVEDPITTPIIEEVPKHNKSMKKLKFKVKIVDDPDDE
jgi:restriction endonuclease S subunit